MSRPFFLKARRAVGFFFLWLVCAILVSWWASKRGRLWFDYFLLSLVLSPVLSGIILAIKPDLKKEAAAHAAKKAEEARHEQEREEAREQIESIKALTNKPSPQAVGSVADELAKLAKLRDDGVLTPAEFDAQKAALLAPRNPST